MLILGIETATEQVGVAVGGHEGVIARFEVTRGRRHAETLAPAIDFVLRQAGVTIDELAASPSTSGRACSPECASGWRPPRRSPRPYDCR